MLTSLEITFIRDIIKDLTALVEPSEYTKEEVDQALELLNKLQPIDCEKGLEVFSAQVELNEKRGA